MCSLYILSHSSALQPSSCTAVRIHESNRLKFPGSLTDDSSATHSYTSGKRYIEIEIIQQKCHKTFKFKIFISSFLVFRVAPRMGNYFPVRAIRFWSLFFYCIIFETNKVDRTKTATNWPKNHRGNKIKLNRLEELPLSGWKYIKGKGFRV